MAPDVEKLPPGFGKLGDTAEDHERSRIEGLAAAGPQPPVPVRERADLPAATEVRAAKLIVREMLGEVRSEVHELGRAIHEQASTLRTIDVPLEQVADSHERATHSFETLRAEFAAVDARVALVEAQCSEILRLLRQSRG